VEKTPSSESTPHKLLDNDVGSGLSIVGVSNAVGGTVSYGTDGVIAFTPNADSQRNGELSAIRWPTEWDAKLAPPR